MMHRLKKYCLMLLIALMALPALAALPVGDDDDKDPSIRPGIRRLYPQRERAKAMKKFLPFTLGHERRVMGHRGPGS